MANQWVGKASSDIPALKPYRGKPAVRNFRGGDGDVGIMRSPVRAIALPDLLAGGLTLAKGAISGVETAMLAVAVLLILLQYKVNPALLVLASAGVGLLIPPK